MKLETIQSELAILLHLIGCVHAKLWAKTIYFPLCLHEIHKLTVTKNGQRNTVLLYIKYKIIK